MTEYRIEFSITKREEGEEDFTEFAFGYTGANSTIDDAGLEAHSAIQNSEWNEV